MKNKIELIYVAKDNGTAEISMKANADGSEIIIATIGIIDSIATKCTRNSAERTFFLKAISKAILKLI